jgi:hypothetical protein
MKDNRDIKKGLLIGISDNKVYSHQPIDRPIISDPQERKPFSSHIIKHTCGLGDTTPTPIIREIIKGKREE